MKKLIFVLVLFLVACQSGYPPAPDTVSPFGKATSALGNVKKFELSSNDLMLTGPNNIDLVAKDSVIWQYYLVRHGNSGWQTKKFPNPNDQLWLRSQVADKIQFNNPGISQIAIYSCTWQAREMNPWNCHGGWQIDQVQITEPECNFEGKECADNLVIQCLDYNLVKTPCAENEVCNAGNCEEILQNCKVVGNQVHIRNEQGQFPEELSCKEGELQYLWANDFESQQKFYDFIVKTGEMPKIWQLKNGVMELDEGTKGTLNLGKHQFESAKLILKIRSPGDGRVIQNGMTYQTFTSRPEGFPENPPQVTNYFFTHGYTRHYRILASSKKDFKILADNVEIHRTKLGKDWQEIKLDISERSGKNIFLLGDSALYETIELDEVKIVGKAVTKCPNKNALIFKNKCELIGDKYYQLSYECFEGELKEEEIECPLGCLDSECIDELTTFLKAEEVEWFGEKTFDKLILLGSTIKVKPKGGESGGILKIKANEVTLSSSHIDADGSGWPANQGPGAGSRWNNRGNTITSRFWGYGGSGGGHARDSCSNFKFTPGKAYGDPTLPELELGSGGGTGLGGYLQPTRGAGSDYLISWPVAGGAGGGGIQIEAPKIKLVNSNIIARGLRGFHRQSGDAGGGGGSGGSIKLIGNVELDDNSLISAKGGAQSGGSYERMGCPGMEGRIRIIGSINKLRATVNGKGVTLVDPTPVTSET